MTIRNYSVTVTSDGAGAATVFSGYLTGYLNSIRYVKVDYTNGVDFTITAEATGETLWTESNVDAATIRYPRAGVHTGLGAASLYAAGGTAVNDRIALGRDRVKIVLAAAGATKVGTFVISVDDRR